MNVMPIKIQIVFFVEIDKLIQNLYGNTKDPE